MSTQPVTPRRQNAPARKTTSKSPSTPAPPPKKAVARSPAPAKAQPPAPKAPAPKAPVREARAASAPAPAAGKAAPRTASKPGAAALPSLRFHHSHALRERTLVVIDAIETGPAARHHGEALADLVAELVQAGMDWYFFRPLQRAQVGFMAEQSARLGLNTATKMINSASRGFILRMNHPQLRVVAAYLREIS